MSLLEKSLLKSKLPPLPPSGLASASRGKRPLMRKREYTPLPWTNYFSSSQTVAVGENAFRVYQAKSSESAGSSPLPLIVLLHGGGFSALTWSLFTAEVTKMVACQVLAIDLRGHGDTRTVEDDDMSAEVLASDVGSVLEGLYGGDCPPVVLMGHSMGGAIAVHVANANLIPSLIGLAVIDVVEGTALDALTSMQSVLRGRPKFFTSVQHAIEWCVRSGQVRNLESARVSMPGQIQNTETGETATTEVSNSLPSSPSSLSGDGRAFLGKTAPAPDSIAEENEDGDVSSSSSSSFKAPFEKNTAEKEKLKYCWRIDLAKTEQFWTGWFQGLSNLFLACPVPKMLLLAGIDRLDRDLTVGQMQGKFQMQVLPQCGHAVQEDVPDKVAEVIASFLVRHRVAEPLSGFQRSFPAC